MKGWTWLGYLNFLVIQWFFVRLARVLNDETNETIGYHWFVGVMPLTGWWNDYYWLWKGMR